MPSRTRRLVSRAESLTPRTPGRRGERCGARTPMHNSSPGSHGSPHATAADRPARKACDGATSRHARASCRRRSRPGSLVAGPASPAWSVVGHESGRRRTPWKGRSRSRARMRAGECPARSAAPTVNTGPNPGSRGRGEMGMSRAWQCPDERAAASVYLWVKARGHRRGRRLHHGITASRHHGITASRHHGITASRHLGGAKGDSALAEVAECVLTRPVLAKVVARSALQPGPPSQYSDSTAPAIRWLVLRCRRARCHSLCRRFRRPHGLVVRSA